MKRLNGENEGNENEREKEADRLTERGAELFNTGEEGLKKEAVECFEKAVELCDCAAAYANLGIAYFHGGGVEKNYEKAAKFFARGAKLGDPVAMYSYAICLREGLGTERSPREGFGWLERSARLGYPAAEYEYGCCEALGGKDEESVDEGIWFVCDAAVNGERNALCRVSQLDDDKAIVMRSNEGDVVSERALTGDQIAMIALCMCEIGRSCKEASSSHAAEEEAVFWLDRAASDGNTRAMCNLAYILLDEDSPLHSSRRAAALIFEAAALGDPDAEFMVGQFYHMGAAVERDEKKAYDLLVKAAEGGSSDAREYLARYFD